jgi:phosphoglycolate phosphatase
MNALRGIKVVIWDLDGVVVDTMPDIVGALRASARAVGYGELTAEQTSNKVGGGAVKAFTKLFGPDDERFVAPAVEYFGAYYPEHCADTSTLYGGIPEVFAQLDGHVGVAMATAKIRSATLRLLESLGVRAFFDYLVTADDMQRMKPDPQCVEMILAHFGVEPSAAVIIGDMATDIQAGKAAGIRTIGVTYGYGKLADLIAAAPDILVDQPADLLGAIEWAGADRSS